MGFVEYISSKQWAVAGSIILPLVFFLSLCILRDTTPETQSTFQNLKETAFPESYRGLPLEVGTALARYVSSKVIPQQTFDEIMMTVRVLAARGPCNFLVFGLGFDSVMWKTLNHGGRTVFLEETEDWIKQVTGKNPDLEAYLVRYNTKLMDAGRLMDHARKNRNGKCRPVQAIRNSTCKIALSYLPKKLYEVDWDVIMVDAPRGYFAEAPGRMAAIFSASVMARSRKNGTTDIYVHDVERPVERQYCEEFLCRANLVEEAPTKRLWHFRLAPQLSGSSSKSFC
ncbi:glucuronoxylan 4-O-methyltransferase 3 [Selaginella moellendorffii]|nr:glucuronoxylan 4-O-methyltransferase 3 [Selaginella moellendorffii]|eukprot:XP_002983636.2 glucuronoxylan 4-O-methyltransferase 3 [Selaginella moellendorffii]